MPHNAEKDAPPPREGRPVQGCMVCATYRSEGRACPDHRRVLPPERWDEEADAMFIDKAREAIRDTTEDR